MARTRHFYCRGPCSIPDWGPKILKAKRYSQKKRERERFYYKNKIVNIVHFFFKGRRF